VRGEAALNKIFLVIVAALLQATSMGCNAFPAHSSSSNAHHCASYCPTGHDNFRDFPLIESPCGSPYLFDKGHRGVWGILHKTGNEFNALVHCLFSYRWEGGYPYGPCGPWVGSWDCPCGSGGVDDPYCCNSTCP